MNIGGKLKMKLRRLGAAALAATLMAASTAIVVNAADLITSETVMDSSWSKNAMFDAGLVGSGANLKIEIKDLGADPTIKVASQHPDGWKDYDFTGKVTDNNGNAVEFLTEWSVMKPAADASYVIVQLDGDAAADIDAYGGVVYGIDYTLVSASTVDAAPAEEAPAAPAAGDVDAATDSSKGSPDTGIADVAAVAGLAVLAIGGVVFTKKRK